MTAKLAAKIANAVPATTKATAIHAKTASATTEEAALGFRLGSISNQKPFPIYPTRPISTTANSVEEEISKKR